MFPTAKSCDVDTEANVPKLELTVLRTLKKHDFRALLHC